MKKQNELQDKLKEYLTPEIGVAIRDACDLIIRLRLGQLNIVAETLKRYCNLHQEGKGVSLDEPLYKGVELGEYLMCLKEHPDCNEAGNCWITRKGFCPKRIAKDKKDLKAILLEQAIKKSREEEENE